MVDGSTDSGGGGVAQQSGKVLLNGRYQLDPSKPQPQLNSPTAQAFVAVDKKTSGEPLFALICRPQVSPRVDVMEALKGSDMPGVLTLHDYGICDWRGNSGRALAVVLSQPPGPRMWANLDTATGAWSADEITVKIIVPLLDTFKAYERIGIAHRGIRPDNMFWANDNLSSVVLGEAVTVPPGHDQPAVFESVENAMAMPTGRSGGGIKEDLYALGMTVLSLLLGRNPGAAVDTDALIIDRLERGSLVALLGDEKLSRQMTILLCGLLCDDPEARWDVGDLERWANHVLPPPQPEPRIHRAEAPAHFAESDFKSPRALAHAFSRNMTAAAQMIMGKSLERWLHFDLGNRGMSEAVAKLREAVGDRDIAGQLIGDVLVARVCIVLDPAGPLRFRSWSAMPDGSGAALASVMAIDGDTKDFSEAVLNQLPILLAGMMPESDIKERTFTNLGKGLRATLNNKNVGFGIERSLYELNPDLPCLSPLVVGSYVTDLDKLLPALETRCQTEDFQTASVDRHVAAFIGARDPDITVRVRGTPRAGDAVAAGIFELRLLAEVQYRTGNQSFPGLIKWLAKRAGPIIMGFHSKARRDRINEMVKDLGQSSTLTDLIAIIDNAGQRSADINGYLAAKEKHRANAREIDRLQHYKKAILANPANAGGRAAATTALICTGGALVLMASVWWSGAA
jgi:hypothetical protein